MITKPGWQKFLELFQRQRTWSNYELRDLKPVIVNPPKKVLELRRKGYNIITEFDLIDKRKIYYTYVSALILGLFLTAGQAQAFPESGPEFNSLVNTIIQAESSGDALAIGDWGRSLGLMQIQYSVWQQYTRKPFILAFDAELNRKVGEAHVRHIIERYGAQASRPLILLTYNTGRFYQTIPAWAKHHKNNIYREEFNA